MKTMRSVVTIALLVGLVLGVSPPAEAQINKAENGWVSTFTLKIDGANAATDRNTQSVGYSASQADTTERVWFEGADYVIDSMQYRVVTNDTCRYRTALLWGTGSQWTPNESYGLTIGTDVPLDTLSAVIAKSNGMYSASLVPAGAGWQALVIQHSAAGNHSAGVTPPKYEVWVKAFYRNKKVP